MKKFLLATSALFGAAALATGAHADAAAGGNAGGLAVTLGGSADFQVGIKDQDALYDTTDGSQHYQRDAHFANETKLNVKVDGTSDNGLNYGAVIELEADLDANPDTTSNQNADRAYIYLSTEKLGRVELGGNTGAADTLKVDASSIARATGGIDGDWYRYVDTTISGAGFIIRPDLPVAHARGNEENAEKVNYYTPRFSGLQVGVSFTPQTDDIGTTTALSAGTTAGQFENVFDLGANWQGQFDQVGVEVSATGTIGDSQATSREDLGAWAVGAKATTQGFSVAGSYGSWGDSNLTTGAKTEDTQNYWTVGGAYETGPFGLSVTYLNSRATDTTGGNRDKFDNVSIGADYQLAPGLVPYAEVSFFDLNDGSGSSTDNSGSVVLIGTQLNF